MDQAIRENFLRDGGLILKGETPIKKSSKKIVEKIDIELDVSDNVSGLEKEDISVKDVDVQESSLSSKITEKKIKFTKKKLLFLLLSPLIGISVEVIEYLKLGVFYSYHQSSFENYIEYFLFGNPFLIFFLAPLFSALVLHCVCSLIRRKMMSFNFFFYSFVCLYCMVSFLVIWPQFVA
jgi:hypothetical protein